jgi:hypothetical protein
MWAALPSGWPTILNGMNAFDYSIVALYFAAMIGLGIRYRHHRRALHPQPQLQHGNCTLRRGPRPEPVLASDARGRNVPVRCLLLPQLL